MITAVDSNVLLDVFLADKTHGQRSAALLRISMKEGRVVACDAVSAEVCAVFPSPDEAGAALDRLGIVFDPISETAASAAGASWHRYRSRDGTATPERGLDSFRAEGSSGMAFPQGVLEPTLLSGGP